MYIFCEWESIQDEYKNFQLALQKGENKMIQKCNAEWAPKTFGYLTPSEGQYGRTTILPELLDDWNATQMAHWRQQFTTAGHQLIIAGAGAGNTLPEDLKVLWTGLAFPNKQMNISEVKWYIGDRKYGRLDLEEIHSYNKPAIVFQEPFIIDEETAFELYGYVEEPDFQRIVMLGATYYKYIDKVLGNCGAAIA